MYRTCSSLVLACLLFPATLDGGEIEMEEKAGALSPALLNDIRESYKFDDDDRMRHNAVTNNSIKSLSLNRGLVAGSDGHFSHQIELNVITNQKASGRCWLFAGLNTMRPTVARTKQIPDFEFSVAYLQFWDKMEKSNLFLETMIEMRETDYLDREWESVQKWTMSDGGWWNYVVDLVEKYGAVPKDVMPETQSSENTAVMNTVLDRMLRADAVKLRRMHEDGSSVDDLRAFKVDALRRVYRFLVINLGEPPTEFEWRYEFKKKASDKDTPSQKDDPTTESLIAAADAQTDRSSAVENLSTPATYTPKEFYEAFVGTPLRDYVCLYNDPLGDEYKHYKFKRARNIYGKADMNFINVPIDDLKDVAMKSVVANEPVWFAADVSKDQSSDLGIMAHKLYDYDLLFDVDTKVSKVDRLKLRDGGSNHAMVFMGVDVRDGKPVKWLVENSWGSKRGNEGKWTLYDDWFDHHVYTLIINKRHVSQKVLDQFETEATELPPWYPGAPGIR